MNRLALQRFLSLALVLVIPLFLAACGSLTQSSDSTNLVPANANLIAQIQVSRILEDSDFQALYQKAPKSSDDPQTFEELLAKGQEETGIDFRKFTTATLFGDVTQDDEYFGVIARGPVNEQLLVAALNASSDIVVSTEEYNGVQIYTAESDSQKPVFAVLDNDTTVLGTLPAVQDVIDVKQGTLAGISGPVYDAFNDLGTPLVSLAVAIPPETLAGLENSMGGAQGFGMMPAMESLQDITVMAFLIDKLGQDLKVEARLGFLNADSATEMGDTLDGLLKLASAFSQDESVRSLLKKLEIVVDGSTMTASFQAPLAEIEEVTQTMGQNFGGQY